jgi:hypothetical protein
MPGSTLTVKLAFESAEGWIFERERGGTWGIDGVYVDPHSRWRRQGVATCSSCRHRVEQDVRRKLPAIKRRAVGVDADPKCAESIPATAREQFSAPIAEIGPTVASDAGRVRVDRERDEPGFAAAANRAG